MENWDAQTEHPTSAVPQELTPTSIGHEGLPLDKSKKPNWREIFRLAFRRARQQGMPAMNRRELSRDRSKSMFLLLALAVGLLLIFFAIFSSPRKPLVPGDMAHGPNLGRKPLPGQQDASSRVAPMLNADVQTNEGTGHQLSPEDIGRTSRFGDKANQPPRSGLDKPSPMKSAKREDYALKDVDFSDPAAGQSAAAIANQAARRSEREQASDLKKPSIVFVRSVSAKPALKQLMPQPSEARIMSLLPAGTRLMARLQAPVSSAIPTPVLAVVEYNYERDGQIVLPAGATVVGRVTAVNASGLVGIHFYQVEMPDGGSQSIDASAMDLAFSPLRGYVRGRRRAARFLVRSLAGVGTVAAYMVGGHGRAGFEGPISENMLLRERIADNIGMAGQDQLNTLSVNQNVVVTLPGNTRFYIVIERGGRERDEPSGVRTADSASASVADSHVPSLEELRELMQLRRELNQMYLPSAHTGAGDPSVDPPR